MHMLDMDAILGPKKARGGADIEDSDSAAEEVGQNRFHDRSETCFELSSRKPFRVTSQFMLRAVY